MSELRPCPFCGGKPTLESNKDNYGDYYTLAFVHCPCGGQSGMSESDSQAIEYWNRRPIEDELREELYPLQVKLDVTTAECDELRKANWNAVQEITAVRKKLEIALEALKYLADRYGYVKAINAITEIEKEKGGE